MALMEKENFGRTFKWDVEVSCRSVSEVIERKKRGGMECFRKSVCHQLVWGHNSKC